MKWSSDHSLRSLERNGCSLLAYSYWPRQIDSLLWQDTVQRLRHLCSCTQLFSFLSILNLPKHWVWIVEVIANELFASPEASRHAYELLGFASASRYLASTTAGPPFVTVAFVRSWFQNVPWKTGTPVTSLGHQEKRRVFWEGPNLLNYVQYFQTGSNTFFQGGGNVSKGSFATLRPPGYGSEDWWGKLCWWHPRESDTEVVLAPSKVTTSATLPCSIIQSSELTEIAVDGARGISSLARADTCPSSPLEESEHENWWNEWIFTAKESF